MLNILILNINLQYPVR